MTPETPPPASAGIYRKKGRLVMLQIPNPDEEEFLGSLRKRADSVTPPPSLSPDAIKKQLPERPKITLTRRLAPFAAAAACLALILTGIGAAMSLDMRLIPNPGDGIVQAISDFIHKSVGFTKNCFDILNVAITVMISLVFIGHFYGIGIGTVLAMICVGRFIALFNYLAKAKITALAGVEE